jgi:hypothetical protein
MSVYRDKDDVLDLVLMLPDDLGCVKTQKN